VEKCDLESDIIAIEPAPKRGTLDYEVVSRPACGNRPRLEVRHDRN
jgi:hypothetical protein